MKIARSEVFKKDYQRLPDQARKAAAKQITQLLLDHTHPSLRIEGIGGHTPMIAGPPAARADAACARRAHSL